MIRTILSLGRNPRSRRIFAALILMITAIGASLLRNDGAFLAVDLASSLVVAFLALGLLHLRWRRQEVRGLNAQKLKETFS